DGSSPPTLRATVRNAPAFFLCAFLDKPMIAAGYEAAKKLLGLAVRPDAIFAAVDFIAIGALQAARQTPLSSVDIHPVEVGKSAASILLGMINGKPAPRKPVFLDPKLVVRASS